MYYLGMFDEDDAVAEFLAHFGTGHEADGTPHSGRYPWQSGEKPNQHPHYREILEQYEAIYTDYINQLHMTPEEAKYNAQKACGLLLNGGVSDSKIEALRAGAAASEKLAQYNEVKRLMEGEKDADGNYIREPMGATEIAKKLGMANESSVRTLIKDFEGGKKDDLLRITEYLEHLADTYGFVDVTSGTAEVLSEDKPIKSTMIDKACALMEADGYYYGSNHQAEQLGTGHMTTMKIIGPEGAEYKDAQKAVINAQIAPIKDFEKEAAENFKESSDPYHNPDGVMWDPVSLDSSRLMIRYTNDDGTGGVEDDGTIEIRKGVLDLDLDGASYAQVRIAVDGKYYMKGMAVYSDNIPDGVDVVFNSNKSADKGIEGALKPLKIDKATGELLDNPFGTSLTHQGQHKYVDPETGELKQSVINKVRNEGEWDDWSRTLASQFLAKQDTSLIKTQLAKTVDEKREMFDDLQSVSNPVIREKLLNDFAEECDSAAKYLKATALEGQTTKVLLPLNDQKDNECYCPTYETGTQVALIRYPLTIVNEIPIRTVNNENPAGKSRYGNLRDGIGLTMPTRVQMSGADCDGDTCVVIPLNNGLKIKNGDPIKELMDFNENKDANYGTWDTATYGDKPPYKIMPKSATGQEMGVITNLITDMHVLNETNLDAKRVGTKDEDEYTRDMIKAIEYSYIVIDANKHKLDYTRAKKELGIDELHLKYQGNKQGGASTILSRAKSQQWVDEQSSYGKVDPETGKISYAKKYEYARDEDGHVIRDSTGKIQYATDAEGNKIKAKERKLVYQKDADGNDARDPITKKRIPLLDENGKYIYTEKDAVQKSTKMAEAEDARELMSGSKQNKETKEWTYSGTIVENLYANYANSMKTMANEARLAALGSKGYSVNANAQKVYAKEVESLNEKLRQAKLNSPRERQATIAASHIYHTKLAESGYSLESDEKKKLRGQTLDAMRQRFGAAKQKVKFTDREWQAIQNGACTKSLLQDLMKNCNKEELADKAVTKIGRKANKLSAADVSRIKSLAKNANNNYASIAEDFGISASTVGKIVSGEYQTA